MKYWVYFISLTLSVIFLVLMIFFMPPYYDIAGIKVNMLNVKYAYLLNGYEYRLDALANLVAGKVLCRSSNLYRVLVDALQNSTNTTIYLVSDKQHVVGYYNNTVYDVTAPGYKFNKKDIVIIKCTLLDYDIEIVPKCEIIYAFGEYIPQYKKIIDEILIRVT